MWKRLFWGSLAGLAGGLAMRVVVKTWETLYAGDPQHGPFGLDVEADRNAAVLMCRQVSDVQLSDREAEFIGATAHYALSAVSGAGYLSGPEWVRTGRGIPYGLAIWLFGDLLAVSATGVSDPRSKTADSHAVAFAAHVLYGIMIDRLTGPMQR